MARRDLRALRAQIIEIAGSALEAPLSRRELRALAYAGLSRLSVLRDDLLAILDAEVEYELEREAPEPIDVPELYDEFDDDYGEYEYEIIIEGGNTRPALGS